MVSMPGRLSHGRIRHWGLSLNACRMVQFAGVASRIWLSPPISFPSHDSRHSQLSCRLSHSAATYLRCIATRLPPAHSGPAQFCRISRHKPAQLCCGNVAQSPLADSPFRWSEVRSHCIFLSATSLSHTPLNVTGLTSGHCTLAVCGNQTV